MRECNLDNIAALSFAYYLYSRFRISKQLNIRSSNTLTPTDMNVAGTKLGKAGVV